MRERVLSRRQAVTDEVRLVDSLLFTTKPPASSHRSDDRPRISRSSSRARSRNGRSDQGERSHRRLMPWSARHARLKCQKLGRRTTVLFRNGWHGRGMMIDNEPPVAVLDVSEAVARRQGLGLSILGKGERVIAGIDRRAAVDADQLIAEGDLEAGKNPKGRHEVIPQRRLVGA